MSRRRATVVAIGRDNRVLLVMDKGSSRFSLPGGGVHRGEPSIAAAARELYEETGLNCSRIEWQFEHKSKFNRHEVFLAIPKGRVQLKDGELERYLWWDGMESIRFRESAIDILLKVGWLNWDHLGPMQGHRTWRQLGPPHRIRGYDHAATSQKTECD